MEGEQLVSYFLNYPWADWLQKMNNSKEEDIHFSPTLNFENKQTKQKLMVSGVEENGRIFFYVFYQRPKTVSQFFGLRQKVKEDYTTEVHDQSKEQAALLIEAFSKGNEVFLEKEINR
ncbi:hypothetical protein [Rufibacter sp. LB8]|nr:hypothetical protein [Rufibacter sp. LB8]